MLISTGLVMLMTPALGFFEAGFVRSKNSLSIIMQTISGLGILSILWIPTNPRKTEMEERYKPLTIVIVYYSNRRLYSISVPSV
jgi:hypothetical protein